MTASSSSPPATECQPRCSPFPPDNDLDLFLATAHVDSAAFVFHGEGLASNRYDLPVVGDGSIHCVRWANDFYITGPDIRKVLQHKLRLFGRVVQKHDAERVKLVKGGLVSDLRKLKPGPDGDALSADSTLLDLLDLHLHEFGCITTKRKQFVYKWTAVCHNELLLSTLERAVRLDAVNAAAGTVACHPPAPGCTLLELRSFLRSPDTRFAPLDSHDSQIFSFIRPDGHPLQPFACKTPGCTKRYSRKEHLERHQAASHNRERRHRCEACDGDFTRADNLRTHYRSCKSKLLRSKL